jgi:DNA-binding MarR family transcriptional regulator
MKATSTVHGRSEIRTLARFRSEIRQFLQFSEEAAAGAGLQPQQHQLLLQIAGAPEGILVTVSYIAGVMSLRHHTVVELSKRCEVAGYVRRTHDLKDRRCVVLELTAKGEEALHQLSEIHARQLRELAPSLIEALTHIRGGGKISVRSSEKRSDEEK